MPNMKEIVIANLSMDFALRIVHLYNYLSKEKREYVLSTQLLRCGTSIGANIAESEHAQSPADFVAKLSISLKEANESKYWITLLHRAEYLSDKEYESIMKDLRIIIGTLVNTIKKTKGKYPG
jgi:four helix bundle protein